MTEFKLPELGENIHQGDLVRLMVAPGATVAEGEPVMELETDKAVIEVPSSVSGTVKDVLVKQGEKIKVGQVIFTVENGAGGKRVESGAVVPEPAKSDPKATAPTVSKAPAKAANQAASASSTTRSAAATVPSESVGSAEFRLPELGENIHQGDLVRLMISPGAQVAEGQPVMELETDKAVVEVPSSLTGIVKEVLVNQGEQIKVGQVVFTLEAGATSQPHPRQPALPDFIKWGKIERVPMRGVRRKTAEHMWEAWTSIPHVTQNDKADITELEQLRTRFGAKAQEAGGKMTVTAIALKVCASALKIFPQFNASIDMEKEEIVYKQFINIGVAVDTDRGLLVPVIREVDKKNIVELAAELTGLSKKARDKKLTPADMEGGTFTITNLGGIGGTGFSPIVNYPEVAILGLSRSSMEPVWMNGKFEPRQVLPLLLSYDHRLIDGADAARFLRWIAEAFEQPFLLSVQG